MGHKCCEYIVITSGSEENYMKSAQNCKWIALAKMVYKKRHVIQKGNSGFMRYTLL